MYSGVLPDMLTLWQDVRYGLRGMRASAGFSALAMITVGLGIGAGTTMFSVIKNVLIAPFPYAHADRIVAFDIHDLDSGRPGGRPAFKPAEYIEFRRQNHVFEDDTGGGNEDLLMTTNEGTERYDGAYVTPNTFDFLGVPALLGRTITPADGKPGAPPVFVMSYKMWQSRFNGDASILGRTFVLNNTPTTLIGIMPKRFTKRGADRHLLVAGRGARQQHVGDVGARDQEQQPDGGGEHQQGLLERADHTVGVAAGLDRETLRKVLRILLGETLRDRQ